MLNKPPLCDLMEHVDSKYGLVIMVAKRARSVVDHNPDVVSTGRFNAVSMAMREVADGKLHWQQDADAAAAVSEEAAEQAEQSAEEAAEENAAVDAVDADLPEVEAEPEAEAKEE